MFQDSNQSTICDTPKLFLCFILGLPSCNTQNCRHQYNSNIPRDCKWLESSGTQTPKDRQAFIKATLSLLRARMQCYKPSIAGANWSAQSWSTKLVWPNQCFVCQLTRYATYTPRVSQQGYKVWPVIIIFSDYQHFHSLSLSLSLLSLTLTPLSLSLSQLLPHLTHSWEMCPSLTWPVLNIPYSEHRWAVRHKYLLSTGWPADKHYSTSLHTLKHIVQSFVVSA